MLKVGVKGNNVNGSILECEIDPRLQRSTLSEVNWVPQNMGTGSTCPNACQIRGAIIDHGNVRAEST